MEEALSIPQSGTRTCPHLTPATYAAIATALTVFCSAALLPLWVATLPIWRDDPLRSIGAVFPILALLGVLGRWRNLGFGRRGSSWGLAVLALSLPLARFVSVSNLNVTLAGDTWTLLHGGPALFLYGVGATLLFGGPSLLRPTLAPLCLLLAINPVPHSFNVLADLPLQQLSASAARAFAHLIGLQPTGEQLKMMFAPNFGMMIVPGCNGVRGSITLAYLTLIFGYTRRLRPRRLAAATLAALILGYALNLLRLCLLVIYYRIGLNIPSIQSYGVQVDYAIGCTVFLAATVATGVGIRALEPHAKPPSQPLVSPSVLRPAETARAFCFLLLSLLFIVPGLRSLAQLSSSRPNEQQVLALFPQQIGPFRLVRTYAEHDGYGGLAMGMADYAASPDRRITFGVWVGPPGHRLATSRVVQGRQADSTASFDSNTASGKPVHLITSFYDDGISRIADAEAACALDGCSDSLVGGGTRGFLFSAPSLRDAALPAVGKRLPILFESEWLASVPTPPATLRANFEQDVKLLTQKLDLQPFVRQLGSQP